MFKLAAVLIFAIAAYANIFAGSGVKKSMEIKGDFAKTKQCIRCHLKIYEEYNSSTHFNSTTERDLVHKKVWEAYKKETKSKKYGCGRCHTPLVKKLEIKSLPKQKKLTDEAISCAYCHRIEAIHRGKKFNKNIISKKKGVYFGTREPETRSNFHKIVNTNPIHKNGDTCMGCHGFKKNGYGFTVCQTESNNTLKQNCITCHMPQIEGSLSDRIESSTHAYHGFAGIKRGHRFLRKYVELDLKKNKDSIVVTLKNHAPHSLLLHPLRAARLVVEFYDKNGKPLKTEKRDFVRIIGKEGRPTPPWLAKEVVKDSMIGPGEKRVFKFEPPKGAKMAVARLLIYDINPKMAKRLGVRYKEIEFKKSEIEI